MFDHQAMSPFTHTVSLVRTTSDSNSKYGMPKAMEAYHIIIRAKSLTFSISNQSGSIKSSHISSPTHLACPTYDPVLSSPIVCPAKVVCPVIKVKFLTSHTDGYWAQVFICTKHILVLCDSKY